MSTTRPEPIKQPTIIGLGQCLARKFPGLVFPDKAPIRPGELIGFLSQWLQANPALVNIAEKNLPKKDEEGKH